MKVRISQTYPVKKMRGVELDLELIQNSPYYYTDKKNWLMFYVNVISKNPQWFEKIEEYKISPKYKVWDYVVYEEDGVVTYIKICELEYLDNEYIYNWIFTEEDLRDPTEEELKLYYR